MFIHVSQSLQDQPRALMARIEGISGATPITQADITGITYRVWEYASHKNLIDNTSGSEIGTVGTLTVEDVIFDTLQLDDAWTRDNPDDELGYNFRFTLPRARLPTGGKFYLVRVVVDPADAGEEDFAVLFEIETLGYRGT